MTAPAPWFELQGVGLRCGRVQALADVDLRVLPGERVALVGANGSGKSTFVNLVPRFFDPQAGSILLDGVDLAPVPPYKASAPSPPFKVQY